MDSALTEEIVSLRVGLQNRHDFNNEMGMIDKFTRVTRDECEAKKEKILIISSRKEV